MVSRALRALTPKQEAFAAALAAGVTQAEAYRRAFPASLKWQDASVWKRASDLAKHGGVRGRVAELQAKAADAAVFTLADHLRNLDTISKAALAAEDFSAAARAEESRGRASGFYVQRLEHTGKGGGPIETKQTRDLTDAELRAELVRHGIEP
jgi:hypothetical protein